jgi:hypothetical protein
MLIWRGLQPQVIARLLAAVAAQRAESQPHAKKKAAPQKGAANGKAGGAPLPGQDG